MKKIIMLIILAMTVFSCELFSPNYWSEVDKSRAERGVRCYKNAYGNIFCEDKHGNRVH